MRWLVEKEKPKPGDTREYQLFAFLPTEVEGKDGSTYRVWLEFFTCVDECRYSAWHEDYCWYRVKEKVYDEAES